MKKFRLLLIFTIAINSYNYAQDYNLEFGKVSVKELNLRQYPSDTSAPAAILYDMGKSFFVEAVDGGFDVMFERSIKIKIFKKAGFDYATFEIPYYQESSTPELVKDIKASTYNYVDGVIQKTDLKEKDIYDEKGVGNWRNKKFTLPEVHEGSVIEVKYTIQSPYVFNLQDWEFQAKIPVNYSKYIVKMIPFYTYTFLLQGASKFSDYKSYESPGLSRRFAGIEFQDLVHEYTMKNMPAFDVDDKYITTPNDYIVKIDFQLSKISRPDGTVENYVTTWPALNEKLLKSEAFGKYISASERKASDIIKQLNIVGLSTQEKVKAIVNYVKTNYSWNGWNTLFAQQTIKEFLDSKKGSSANINLFLLALLNKAEIEALPVILSTRDHGKIKTDFPFQHFFNYLAVLINVDDKMILTDATETLLPYYLIPPKCINERGLVVVKKTEQWIELSNMAPSGIDYNFNLELNSELDSIKGTFNIIATNYDALQLRNAINDKEENKIRFVEDKAITLLSEVKTMNFEEIEKPYSITFKGEAPIENINGKIYLNPFFNETYKENPMKAKERNFPVDFTYSKQRNFNIIIKIPENYKVTYLPAKTSQDNERFSFNYNIEQSDNSLIISADYYFKKPVYEASEYQNVKFFFWDLVNQMNKKIVLEKVMN